MIFRQLFEATSSTCTYLLGCETTGEAALVDPVLPAWQRDLEVVRSLGLRLALTIETHVHADHITSALRLRRETGSRIAYPAIDRFPCVVRDVRPARLDAQGWHLVDAAGHALPPASRDHRRLLAVSGGHPMHVAAEWDGDALLPLAVLTAGAFERLSA